MIRFFCEGKAIGEWVGLDKESLNHAKALRVREGEEVELLNGRGTVWKGVFDKEGIKITGLQKKDARHPKIALCVGMTQGGTFDDIVKQAVQMGVAELCPLITQRVTVSSEARKLHNKIQRWEKIAEEACKQSGLAWLPKISAPTQFSGAIKTYGSDTNIVASLYGTVTPWKKLDFSGAMRIALWVGPEGDFAKEEYEELSARGASFVSLGDTVLRVETSCVAGLAILKATLS